MSEHLTHVAIFEDSYHIVKHSKEKFTAAFHESLDKAFDSGLFCSGSRGNHFFSIPLLEKNRDIYKQGKATLKHLEQIAGAIGWITHRAADHQMKPIFRIIENQKNPVLTSTEKQMYDDAESFRQVFNGGKKTSTSPYSLLTEATLSTGMKPHPATDHIHTDVFENIFTHYILHEMLLTNNFIQQEQDVEVLVDKIIGQSQDLYEDLRIYIRAFENPEPVKQTAYLLKHNYYNPDDQIIQFVRYAQEHHKPHPSINLDYALGQTEGKSLYAQALKKSYDYLLAASDFFDGKIDKSTVYDAVHNFSEAHRI